MYSPTYFEVASVNIFRFPSGQLSWEKDDAPSSEATPPRRPHKPISLPLISRAQGHCKSHAMSMVTDSPKSQNWASLMSLWLLMTTKRLPGTGIFTTHNVTQSLGDIQSLWGIQRKKSRSSRNDSHTKGHDSHSSVQSICCHQIILWTNKRVPPFSWRRKWQPTPVFLPGEFHGQRSPVGYSPQGLKESDMTEVLMQHLPSLTIVCYRE